MFQRFLASGHLTLVLAVVYALVMAPLAPGFASLENAQNVLVAMLPLLVVASGQTVVLISGGIDLSVTSIIAITSVTGAYLITIDGGPLSESTLATPVAVLVMVGIGAMIGFFNGSCVAWLKMPAFIVTLTSMMFLSGLTIWVSQSQAIYGLPTSFLFLGQRLIASLIFTTAIACVAHFLLSHTLYGKGLRAIGTNAKTARVSGVPVGRYICLAYVISGVSAAAAAILITGQLETGSPVQWENNLLDIIGATVIGGTSLYGGRGSVIWTASGVLLLSLIDNSLNLLNLSHFTIMMAKGGVIILAALLDSLRHRAEAV